MSDYVELDPTEILPEIGVSRQAFALMNIRSLAARLIGDHGAKAVSETAGDAAIRLMCDLSNPGTIESETVTVHRGHLSVMLAAYLVAAETHGEPMTPIAPNVPIS